jgi:hypothetical protein
MASGKSEVQLELFQDNRREFEKKKNLRRELLNFRTFSVSFSMDNLVFGSICLILTLCVVYSLGVHMGLYRGKNQVSAGSEDDAIAEQRVALTGPSGLKGNALSVPHRVTGAAQVETRGSTAGTQSVATPQPVQVPTGVFPSADVQTQARVSPVQDNVSKPVSAPVEVVQYRVPEKKIADSATGKRPYTIQAVTYTSERRAKAEVGRFGRLGLKAFVIPSGKYYQVCVGEYETKKDARAVLLKRVKRTYEDALVRPKSY